MNFIMRTKQIYRIFKHIYLSISIAKKEFIHHLFILYFDTFIYPRLKSFEFQNNVLFFTLPKYYGNKFKDSAVGIYQIIEPLRQFLEESKKEITIHLWFFEENSKGHDVLKFLKQVHILGPQKIIIDSPQYKSAKFKDFGKEIYCYIQEKYDVDLIEIGWDTISEKWWQEIHFSNLDRTILILDNPRKKFVPQSLSDSNKALVMVPPFSLGQIFHVSNHRNLDYNFIGSVGSYRDYRKEYLDFISNLGYNCLLAGFNTRRSQLARKDFLGVLNKSKISINFSMTHTQNFQLKGRVWEVMLAGSMLLEQDNEQIKYFFKAGTHFVSFSDKFQLKENLLHYLNNDSERIKIAEAGQKRAIELIQSSNFLNFITN